MIPTPFRIDTSGLAVVACRTFSNVSAVPSTKSPALLPSLSRLLRFSGSRAAGLLQGHRPGEVLAHHSPPPSLRMSADLSLLRAEAPFRSSFHYVGLCDAVPPSPT